MNKFLRAVAFIVLVINTASPMNQAFGYEEFLCQNLDMAKTIFCLLDGPSFSAIVQACKRFGLICDTIPTKNLVCISFADTVCYGNETLMCRYLEQNLGKINEMSCMPTVVQELLSEQVYGQQIIRLSKIMLGKIGMYKITYDVDGLTDASQYMIYIKGDQDYVLLMISPCQSMPIYSKNFEKTLTEEIETQCFKQAGELCSFLNLSLMGHEEFNRAHCPSDDYFASAICSGEEMIKEEGGNVFLSIISAEASASCPCDRGQCFFLNILFVLMAQKNRTVAIKLILNNKEMLDCLQMGALEVAARLTICPEIKGMVQVLLEQRGKSNWL